MPTIEINDNTRIITGSVLVSVPKQSRPINFGLDHLIILDDDGRPIAECKPFHISARPEVTSLSILGEPPAAPAPETPKEDEPPAATKYAPVAFARQDRLPPAAPPAKKRGRPPDVKLPSVIPHHRIGAIAAKPEPSPAIAAAVPFLSPMRNGPLTDAQRELLTRIWIAHPEASVDQIGERFAEQAGRSINALTVASFMPRTGTGRPPLPV